MLKTFTVCALVVAGMVCSTARADESAVRQAFQAKFPKTVVENVARTPVSGIYEVILDGRVMYTDEKVTYLFSGNLLDVRGAQPRNLTQETTNRLMAAALAKSTDFAVKRVKGNGRRTLYTFEDPNCGYCKELQKELTKVNNVTIYTFLMPILSQDSVEKSKAVWCAKDRGKAWEDLMIKGIVPAGRRDCDTPLEKTERLRHRFELRGTPMVYLANGEQIGGYLPADKIESAFTALR